MNGSKEKDNIKEKSFILYFQMGDNLTRKSVWFLLTLVLLTCHWKFVNGELAGDDIVLGKQRVFSFEYFLNALLMGILFFGLFVRQFVCLFVRVVHSCTMNTFFFFIFCSPVPKFEFRYELNCCYCNCHDNSITVFTLRCLLTLLITFTIQILLLEMRISTIN